MFNLYKLRAQSKLIETRRANHKFSIYYIFLFDNPLLIIEQDFPKTRNLFKQNIIIHKLNVINEKAYF